MIGRSLALAALACSCALADLQLTNLQSGSVCTPDSSVAVVLGTVGTTGGTFPFRITNTGSTSATLNTLKVSGVGFDIVDGPSLPATIASQKTVTFNIALTPTSLGAYGATLWVNKASYVLSATVAGSGDSTTMPKFRIVVDPATLASNQQATLTLEFDSAATADAYGTVTLDPITKGDPGIAFLSAGLREVPFSVTKGETKARFSGESSIGFQTGTTAGSIKFTARLGSETETAEYALAQAAVGIDSIRPTVGTSQIALAVTGYDNTRSAKQVKFTFYDGSSRVLGSTLSADVTSAFAKYFENPEQGGLFVLRAVFPISGDASVVDSVQVEFTNSIASSRANVKMKE